VTQGWGGRDPGAAGDGVRMLDGVTHLIYRV
jgi:hypothetical protein